MTSHGHPDESPEDPDFCSALPDAELLTLAASGDEDAFRMLFLKHYSVVRSVAARILCDLGTADDIAQETFVRFARSMADIRDPSGLRAWLLRVATHLCRDHFRSGTRRASRERDFSALCLPASDEQSQCFHDIPAALAQLPPLHREAVVLVFYENLSHAEAARVADCAVSTLSWRIMLAKRTLKALLSR